jgi:site-specific recombinase XerD
MAAVIPINSFELHQKATRTGTTHPVDALIGRLGIGSRRAYRVALNTIAGVVSNGKANLYEFDWASLTYDDTQRVRNALAERYSPNTANFTLSALRAVLRECWRLELMPQADLARVTDLARVRGDDHMAGRVLKPQELTALLEVCQVDESPAGIRDAAMIAVLYGTGLRRAELTGLNVGDYNGADGTLTVNGKGKKIRLAYVTGEARERLERWLEIRGKQPGALFVSVNKGGSLGNTRLTGGAILQILRRRAGEAKVETFSPHDLRRTTATTLLEKGVDLSTVQRYLGHANVATTCLYDRRSEAAKRKAATVLEFRQ